MNLTNLNVKKTQFIPLGEEGLFKSYDFANDDSEVNLLFAVDGGSTQTRVAVIEEGGAGADEVFVIPSNMVPLKDDREIKPKSDYLYDQLDSALICQSKMTQTMIQRERIVRATKMIDTGLSPETISSTVQKIDESIFYINIVDSIGYALMQKYGNSIPKKVTCAVGVALPPDDMESTKNIDKFRDNLISTYRFIHNDSGVEIEIEIVNVAVETEPGAFVKAYYATTGEEVPEKVLCINTGGRSIGAAVLENSKLNDTASQTFAYGGNQYLAEIGKIYNNRQGGRAPKHHFLARAVQTGRLKTGNNSIDITSDIESAARVYGDRIFGDIVKNVCDRSGISLEDINVVLVCGGMIRRGEHGISLADYIGQKFEERSPYTEFVTVEDNLIPLGVALTVYGEFEDIFVGDAEEEVTEEVESYNTDEM